MWAYPWNNVQTILLHSVLDTTISFLWWWSRAMAPLASFLLQGDGLDRGCIKLCDIITGRIAPLLIKCYLHLFLEVSIGSCELSREFSEMKWNVVRLLVWVNIMLVDWNVVIVFS
jgi:hypothetical protein